MEFISIIIGLIAGLAIGCIIGFLLGKQNASQPVDISGQSAILANLNSQVAEMRGKFVEIERSRAQLEQQRAQYDIQREERLKEWMESTRKLFAEQAEKGKQVDDEKDKRIQELMTSTRQLFAEQAEKGKQVDEEKNKRIQAWMDSTKKFFEEQKEAYTTYLELQGKSREEIEQKRDAQLKDMSGMIQQFTRTISGTKTRGMVGEEQLREVLANSIRAGVVVCDLKTDSGVVEFAWNLDDGKYIPIDCKLPDVFALLEQYAQSEDLAEQKILKSEIIKKLDKEVKIIQKYQNQTNTIDTCILVVPEGILEMVPEIVGLGRESNVFICSYRDIFPVAYVLQEKYLHFKEKGEIGEYQQIIVTLLQIFESINKLTDTINRGIIMITNANNAIKKQILTARQKPRGIDVGEVNVNSGEI